MIYIICAAVGAFVGVISGYVIGAAATMKAITAFIEGDNHVKGN